MSAQGRDLWSEADFSVLTGGGNVGHKIEFDVRSFIWINDRGLLSEMLKILF